MKYKIRLTIAGLVLILAILGFCGFYQIKVLDLQFAPLLQRIFTDVSAAVIFGGIVILTLLFGRFYCSVICPFGILQEFAALVLKKKNKAVANHPVKYFIAAVVFGFLLGGSAIVLRYIEPYTLFGSAITLSVVGVVGVFAVLTLVFFKNRFFCTNICPVGTLLGLLSKLALCKIYINSEKCVSCGLCEKNCPSGCINSKEKFIDNETCIKCLKCLDVCPKGGIKFGRKLRKDVKFSLKRRQVIIGTTALAVLGGMIKAGIVIKDKIVENFKEIILPPGAVSQERLANKCFNCNLCAVNCPNKIITKADDDFPVVHIDYSKGFCKYDCNKCGEVCPTGAIKRLKLEEKQKTRIGMAMIIEDKCSSCGLCAEACPCHAIIKEDGKKPMLNASKCIGCGACKNACPVGAIEIFPVREQKML